MKDFTSTVLPANHHFTVRINDIDCPVHFWLGAPEGRRLRTWITDKEGVQQYRNNKNSINSWYYKDWRSKGACLSFEVYPNRSEVIWLITNESRKSVKVWYLIHHQQAAGGATRFAPSLGGGVLGWLVGGPIGAAVGSLLCGSQVKDT